MVKSDLYNEVEPVNSQGEFFYVYYDYNYKRLLQ